MAFVVLDNLRGFFNSRPPLVVFMICLGSFAVSLITFAYIVKVKDIKDPDVTEDWNTFLEKFSLLEFCVCQNSSLHNATEGKLSIADQAPAQVIQDIPKKLGQQLGSADAQALTGQESLRRVLRRAVNQQQFPSTEGQHLTLTPTSSYSTSGKSELRNVTANIRFQISPNTDFQALSLSLTQFVGSMLPNTLYVKTKGDSDQEKIYVTLSFPENLSKDNCEMMVDNVCSLYSLSTCVTFTAAAHLLPNTKLPDDEVCKAQGEPVLDLSGRNMSVGTKSDTSNAHWCKHGARLTPEYTLDDSLTVFLSLHDKSMINLHLMRTSYFLFVMVLTLFCYAMVKGRPAKVIHVSYEKVSPSSQA